MADTTTTGAPCWLDLFTTDPDRAKSFYGDLFGWTCEVTGEEFGGYLIFSKDGQPVCGGMKNDGTSGGSDGWTVYLSSADARATADAAAAHGGQVIVPAMDVPDTGTMAVVTDSAQAPIGIWQAGPFEGTAVIGQPDTPNWFELFTRDYTNSVKFYEDVFGWETSVAGDTDDFRYTTLGSGDNLKAGIMDASVLPADAPVGWSVYFGVTDTDAAVAKAEQLGGSVVRAAEDSPYGRLAELADPTGATFKVIQPPA